MPHQLWREAFSDWQCVYWNSSPTCCTRIKHMWKCHSGLCHMLAISAIQKNPVIPLLMSAKWLCKAEHGSCMNTGAFSLWSTHVSGEVFNIHKEILGKKNNEFSRSMKTAIVVSNVLQTINMSLNFILYCIVNTQFRKTLESILNRYMCRSPARTNNHRTATTDTNKVTHNVESLMQILPNNW